jgi:hypothetical protein
MLRLRGQELNLRNLTKTESELQEAIAVALWAGYEYSLPDTPGRLAKFVIYHMKETGFLPKKKLKMKAERGRK